MSQRFLLLTVFFCWASSCAKSEVTSDTVVISGRLVDATQPKGSLVTFFVNDFVLCKQLSYYSNIDSAGGFNLKFPIRNTQDIFWSYNKEFLFRLIVSPKDSINIIIDGKGIHFSGTGAKVNEYLNSLWPIYQRLFPERENEKALARLEPEDYLIFRTQQRDKKIKLLDSFCIQRNCSPLFKRWYLADCEVDHFNELFAYSWKSLKYGLGSSTRLSTERKEKYVSSFMEAESSSIDRDRSSAKPFLNLNDGDYTLSSRYMSLINKLSQYYIRTNVLSDRYLKEKIGYLLEFKSELSSSEVRLLEDISKSFNYEREIETEKQKEYFAVAARYKDQVGLKIKKSWTDWEVSETLKIKNPNLRDLIFCQGFCNYLTTHDDANYYFESINSRIKNREYLQAINKEFEEHNKQVAETDQLLKRDFKDIEIANPGDKKSIDQLINSILLANKGKVIFIDVWATWCGPCRADFVNFAPLKKSRPFDSVSFVYLACKSKEIDWVRLIKKYDLKGFHYLITDEQFPDLEKRFKINGFPTYLIIDKHRKLHKDVVLSDAKVLAKKIEELVNQP